MSSITAHFVPGRQFNRTDVENRSIRKPLLQEQKSFLDQISRRYETGYIVGFLHDSASVRSVFAQISKNRDFKNLTILVHGSGGAQIFGYEECKDFAISAPKLALTFAEHLLVIDVNVDVQIDLMWCNSATDAHRHNFARDMSRQLTKAGLPDVFVCGYTGFVLEKGKVRAANGKFSCCNSPSQEAFKSHDDLHQHCSLADARATYLEGSLFEDAKRRLSVLHPAAVLGPGW
eukprot:CAMPEP_0181320486 /NCGR_PEP_ID=MMETSP1101-20121128/18150_1 /TAXON_ID=46948 /ORGANISM="Rhodomonas abbreviata, Strain Caron Lab Isolate" /LENGTH=231 /DNA_ID=CAMNT_0023428195 /DNA_START=28 /DNA_END=720 /DNA_ORIENTATION=-